MSEQHRLNLPRLLNHNAMRGLSLEARLDLIITEIVQAEPFAKQRTLTWMRDRLIDSDPYVGLKLSVSDESTERRFARAFWRKCYQRRREQINRVRRERYRLRKLEDPARKSGDF